MKKNHLFKTNQGPKLGPLCEFFVINPHVGRRGRHVFLLSNFDTALFLDIEGILGINKPCIYKSSRLSPQFIFLNNTQN